MHNAADKIMKGFGVGEGLIALSHRQPFMIMVDVARSRREVGGSWVLHDNSKRRADANAAALGQRATVPPRKDSTKAGLADSSAGLPDIRTSPPART